MAILSHYPFKALFTLYSIVYALLTLPLWFTSSIIPWTRPRREWSVIQAVRMQIVSKVLHYWSVIELNTATPLKPGREKNRFTIAQPAPRQLYTGPLAADSEIHPVPVGLTWTKTPIITSGGAGRQDLLPTDTTVVLHFHGGAFVIGDGRDHDTGFLAATLVKQFGLARGGALPPPTTYVVTPQYRLCCRPGSHFPAALQDAVTSYFHLVHDLGIPARQIVISGDSAGGNMALGLLRYIIEHGHQQQQPSELKPSSDSTKISPYADITLSSDDNKDHRTPLPLPGAVLLWSPWTDLSAAQDPNAIYASPQYKTDYLSGAFGAWGARAYTAFGRIEARSSPYLSPLHFPFASPVPVWIHAGGAEVLLQDCEELERTMRKELEKKKADTVVGEKFSVVGGCGGGQIEMFVSPHCPHDVLLVGAMAGFSKEAKIAARNAGEFWNRVRKVE